MLYLFIALPVYLFMFLTVIVFDVFFKQKINYYSIIFRVFFFFCFAKIFGFSLIFFKLILDLFQFIVDNFNEEPNLFFLSKILEIILTFYFKIIVKILRPILKDFHFNLTDV